MGDICRFFNEKMIIRSWRYLVLTYTDGNFAANNFYLKERSNLSNFLHPDGTKYPPTTPPPQSVNCLPTTPPNCSLSPDYPKNVNYLPTTPALQFISRLPCLGYSGDSLHLWGSREIGGVYFRYFRGYWGSREIFADINCLRSVSL